MLVSYQCCYYSRFFYFFGKNQIATVMAKLLSVVCALVSLILLGNVCAAKPTPQEAQKIRIDNFFQAEETKLYAKVKQRLDKMSASLRVRERRVYATDPGDVEALEAFYKSTDGAKWVNNTGWMKGDPCMDLWHGVYCRDGRVLQLNLVDNQLSGPLPAQLAKATAMQVMRFYSNFLTGSIPTEIFGMKALQIFDANYNQLTGQLPDVISMGNLTDLILYNNQLIGNFPDFNAPLLTNLQLASNTIVGQLPEGLARSKNLKQLVISRNNLTGDLPSSYGVFSQLQLLWIFYNNFDRPSIPDSWSGMTSMQQIQADGLYGAMPRWFNAWSDLQVFVVINGALTGGFPQGLCDSTNLNNLRIFNNSLTGPIDRCICTFSKLTDIEISDNQFSGPMPDCIGNVLSLASIFFSRNNFTGVLPRSIGQLTNLETLDVSQNLMVGAIPNSINNLKDEIAEFAVCYNKFSEIEDGLDDFFARIKNYGCAFYDNPWSCPLPAAIPKECDAVCSKCNTGSRHTNCDSCVAMQGCGWCSQGPNCLEGQANSPYEYRCTAEGSEWKYGTC